MNIKKKINKNLRIITCGSVDDGKSTLIGRLIYETKKLYVDQLKIFKEDNKRFGSQKNKLDFSLLVDGFSGKRTRYNHRCCI